VSSDFEVKAKVRADRLTVQAPPAEGRETTGEGTAIARRELRLGLPKRMQPSGRYTHVVVEKELLGSLVEPPPT
jgi:hypothetical protein